MNTIKFKDQTIAYINPIVIFENGKEITNYHSDFLCDIFLISENKGLYTMKLNVKNISSKKHTIKVIVELKTHFKPTKYLIPCVNYNGNANINDEIPTGTQRDGQNWIFAYDRSSIPSCTLTENKYLFCALFASDKTEDSLRSSSSIIETADNEFIQRIYYPVTEAPYTYSNKRKFTERLDCYLTLNVNEEFNAQFYILVGKPKYINYAFANLSERINEIFPDDKKCILSYNTLYSTQIIFLKSLMDRFEKRLAIAGSYDTPLANRQSGRGKPITPEEMIEFAKDKKNLKFFKAKGSGAGFSSQGILSARMLLNDALKKNDCKMINLSLKMLDEWLKNQTDSGLFYDTIPKKHPYANVCVQGQGIYEMTAAYLTLEQYGINGEKYLKFAEKIADFFIKNYNNKYAFGVVWEISSKKCCHEFGSTGGFIIVGLTELYKATKKSVYLEYAIKSIDYYFKNYLNKFLCSGGAIDCTSVDRESSYPFIRSALDLYEITDKNKYLIYAKKASYYFSSWIYCYDTLFDKKCDFALYGYTTKGATFIGTEHHAIDPYGVIAVPEFYRLYKYTNNINWKIKADMMWKNGLLGITTDKNQIIHGIRRPIGSQSEAAFPCRWTKYRPTCEEIGHFVDFLPSWPAAFRLYSMTHPAFIFNKNNNF